MWGGNSFRRAIHAAVLGGILHNATLAGRASPCCLGSKPWSVSMDRRGPSSSRRGARDWARTVQQLATASRRNDLLKLTAWIN